MEGAIECATGLEDVHLPTETMASVLEMRDSQARPGGGVVFVLAKDGIEELPGVESAAVVAACCWVVPCGR